MMASICYCDCDCDWKLTAVERKKREEETGQRQVVIDTEAIAHQALEFYREIQDDGSRSWSTKKDGLS